MLFFGVLGRNQETSRGRHRSAFVGKKLRDHSESDHPVARCGLSRPRTPFQVRSSLSRPLWLSSAFWDGTKKPSLGHHRSAFVGKKLRDRTTQSLDAQFRGLGPRSKSGRPFLGHYAFLRRFGTEPINRFWGITVRLLRARNFEITQNRSTQ